jgi:acetoacetate decarboxylase
MTDFSIPQPTDAWTTPLDAPAYPRYPIAFRDSEILTIQYRTDPEAIRALLPSPLSSTGDTVLLHIARYGDVPGVGRDIHECNVMVGATYDGPDGVVSGAYSPYFFLDSDRMITFGREVQGQPKRLAKVSLEVRGDVHVGTVVANDIAILTCTLPYKARPAAMSEIRARINVTTNINLKVIPQIDGRIAVRQLVARDLANVSVQECWGGPSTTEIRPNAAAPLYRLPVREFLEGFYWRAEFDLVGGTILHDYEASNPGRS